MDVAEGSPADASAIGELDLGDDAWVTMIVRDGAALQPSKSLELRPGDRVLLLADPEDFDRIERLFAAHGSPVETGSSATGDGPTPAT